MDNSLAKSLYGVSDIKERHRHRYEFNNKYSYILEEKDLHASGRNPQTNLVEIVEIKSIHILLLVNFIPNFISSI